MTNLLNYLSYLGMFILVILPCFVFVFVLGKVTKTSAQFKCPHCQNCFSRSNKTPHLRICPKKPSTSNTEMTENQLQILEMAENQTLSTQNFEMAESQPSINSDTQNFEMAENQPSINSDTQNFEIVDTHMKEFAGNEDNEHLQDGENNPILNFSENPFTTEFIHDREFYNEDYNEDNDNEEEDNNEEEDDNEDSEEDDLNTSNFLSPTPIDDIVFEENREFVDENNEIGETVSETNTNILSFCHFLLTWQSYYQISNSALETMIKFLNIFIPKMGVSNLNDFIPKSLHLTWKSIGVQNDVFEKFACCPKCFSLYKLSELGLNDVCKYTDMKEVCGAPLMQKVR